MGRLRRAVNLVNHRAIPNRCFLSYSPFVTFPTTLTTTMGGGAWPWVLLVALVVCAPWFVSSTRLGPSPPAASTLPLLPWSVLGGRTASFKLTPLTPKTALPGLVRSETTTALESKFVALWVTFSLSLLPSPTGGSSAGCAEGSLTTRVQGVCEAGKGKEAAIAE